MCVEMVEALLRAGKTADGAARAEAARRHHPEADVPLRLSVISALSILNQPDKLIDRAEATLADAKAIAGLDSPSATSRATFCRGLPDRKPGVTGAPGAGMGTVVMVSLTGPRARSGASRASAWAGSPLT